MSACTAPLHCGVTGCLLPGQPSTGCDCTCHPDKPEAPRMMVCAGCDVREPWEHRCSGPCPCPECREADRLFGGAAD